MKVCVANPSLHIKSLYLPYLWARFKTYIDLDFNKDLKIDWAEPIYVNDLDLTEFDSDILALSCYTWNWKTNLKLAAQAKKLNPNCLVIAGGPHVDYKNSDIWNIAKDIDIICYTEGEKVFAELLYAIKNNLDYDNLSGIITRKNPKKKLDIVPKLDLSVLSSPWIHCKDELTKHSKMIKDMGYRVNIAFETNRGCPYSCSFCDWGSATNSKIKKFNNDIVIKEIEIIMAMLPDIIFITDANYGSYPEDLEFINEFVKHKKNLEYNTNIFFSPAKNKKNIIDECYIALYEAGMINTAQLGIQHTDEEVLKYIDRDNIKMEASLPQLKDSYAAGIPLVPALILGNPGDTIPKWKKTFGDVLRMNLHEEIRVHDFNLLPNSPAMEKSYYEKYKLGKLTKLYAEMPNNRNLVETDFLCESFSYDKNDYVEMQIISYFYQAAHICSVYKFLALFAYHTLNIEYEVFYDKVIETPTCKKIINTVRNQLHNYVFGDKQTKFIDYNNITMTLDNFIYVKLLEEIDQIYDQIPIDFGDYSQDLKDFQKFILVNINDKRDSLTLKYDFKEYFRDILTLPAYVKTDLQPIFKKTVYQKKLITGFYNNINISDVNDLETLNKILFAVAGNFRHKTYYYSEVIHNEQKID
jgi:putative methyltransferase